MIKNIPNILTLCRMVVVPIFIGSCYLPLPISIWVTFSLFLFAAISDFFDGWIARRLSVVSKFGRIFDPIADKLIVATALIMLIVFQGIEVIPVVAILCRELLVSGLREGISNGKNLVVSRSGKWKTATQMMAILILLIAPAFPDIFEGLQLTGEIFLLIAALLSWLSAIIYIHTFLQNPQCVKGSTKE